MEIAEAFKDVMNDFLESAETEEQLNFFLLVVTAAWNLSLQPEEQRADFVRLFIKKFGCTSFLWAGRLVNTRHKILELSHRKMAMYPELKHLVSQVEVEDSEDGLEYSMVSQALD